MDTKEKVGLAERLESRPLPAWVREMYEHHERTGCYRVEDIYRVLGNPNKPIEAGSGSKDSLATLFAACHPPMAR